MPPRRSARRKPAAQQASSPVDAQPARPHPWWHDHHGHLSTEHFPVLERTPSVPGRIGGFRNSFPASRLKRWNVQLTALPIEQQPPAKPVKPRSPASKKVTTPGYVLRTRKIRILPTSGQKRFLHQLFNLSNIGYNQAIHHLSKQTELKRTVSTGEDGTIHKTIVRAKPSNWQQLGQYLLSSERNAAAHYRYPVWFQKDYFLNDNTYLFNDLKEAAIKQACDTRKATIASVRERITRIRRNSNHPLRHLDDATLEKKFSMKNRTVHDNFQRCFVKAGSGASIRWSDTGVRFWPEAFDQAKLPREIKVRDKRQLTHLTALSGGNFYSKYQATVKYERPGRYFIIVSVELPIEPAVPQKVVALDPGARTFQTTCDTDGVFGKYGQQSRAEMRGKPTRLMKLALKADKLRSLRDQHLVTTSIGTVVAENGSVNLVPATADASKKAYKQHRRKYKRRDLNVWQKARHLKQDLHRRVANALLAECSDVLIPKFEVQQMTQRQHPNTGLQRGIGRKAVRKLLYWSHYDFQLRLTQMAERFNGRAVHVVGEQYTSKTCSGCGWMDEKLGSKDTFRCKQPACGRVMDRDENAALNIMLKNIEQFVGTVNCHHDAMAE